MLGQLANIIEQLDLAFEHLGRADPNNARFALMLTDNVVELMLHQYAKDERDHLKMFQHQAKEFRHQALLEKALGHHFEEKVRFALTTERLSPESAESIRISHLFRNDLYHVGLSHEEILQHLAVFYFTVACDLCAEYDPRFFGWASNQRLPERAKKYFSGDSFSPGSKEQFKAACLLLRQKAGHDPKKFAGALSDHMNSIVEDQDACIDLVSTGAPHPETREQVVIGCQTWPLAFSDKGKLFAQEHGFPGGNVLALIEWLAKNYPLKFRGDPIPSWRSRAARLNQQRNSHKALKTYRSFMDDTAEIREAINDAAIQVDAYIDGEIERLRMQRH